MSNCASKATERYHTTTGKGEFTVIEGDITKVDWSDADVIYASSFYFPEELMKKISEQGKKLKKGTIIISGKKWISSISSGDVVEGYKTLAWINIKMGWGQKGVYVMEKL